MKKIFIIGSGNVGSLTAALLSAKKLGRVYLYDSQTDLAIGKCLDINQAQLYTEAEPIIGCDDLSEIKNSDIVIIAAGGARKIGMTRDDLLADNMGAFDKIGDAITKYCPNSIIMVVSNPVDILSWYIHHRFSKLNVFGLGCSLDTLRFRGYLSNKIGISSDLIDGVVIGTHNEKMIPVISSVRVNGVNIGECVKKSEIDEIVRKVINSGNEIVEKTKRGSFFTASFLITDIVESIVNNKKKIFSLSVPCHGQYGYDDVFLSLPVVVSNLGIEEVLEINLDEAEQRKLADCVTVIKNKFLTLI